MKIESLLNSIAENWRRDFIAFVQTGEASSNFLEYLDGDLQAQIAVEKAFTEQAHALEGLAQLVKKSSPSTLEKASPAEGVSTAVARAFERITELSGEERAHAVADAARTLVHRAAAGQKADTLRSTLSALQQEVDTLVG